MARQTTAAAREADVDNQMWSIERTERYDALQTLSESLYARLEPLRELFVEGEEIRFEGNDGERVHRPYEDDSDEYERLRAELRSV